MIPRAYCSPTQETSFEYNGGKASHSAKRLLPELPFRADDY
jgi:hypothetical protein